MRQKREAFLNVFLAALGAKKIEWGRVQNDKIFGTVIYDESDPDERQDFVWHMDEKNVPSEEVKELIVYLTSNNLIVIDKIAIPLDELKLDFIRNLSKERVLDELFSVEVRMMDDGEETDRYFIHN